MKYRLEAKFADGFRYFANKQDVSVFDKTRNAYWDILNKLPELHGPAIKISLRQGVLRRPKLSISIPQGAKPVYEIDRSVKVNAGGQVLERADLAFRIGYEKNGKRKTEEING